MISEHLGRCGGQTGRCVNCNKLKSGIVKLGKLKHSKVESAFYREQVLLFSRDSNQSKDYED